ncbi:glycoside hydrolase [Geobacter sulfurreducens]|uniref:glycoside hydrolase family 57 protein n=1 Tax=Geobacter sulfurreducens TaxID=35554 RepID=UPI001BDD8E72|nr:glycoside hydrolase family 57 protein [Geobacter sulfurreducens]QVW35034.1 glycoside hydrolase [Geobacter sulfurreducens]
MTEPLRIVFLWHMHQPYYKDPVKGEYALPWTYLHAVKDYYDMAAIVDATPGAKAVFNLVPSLLDQLLDYASGEATDPWLMRARMSPADMTEDDRRFVLENFFSANRQRFIEPHKRYLELLYQAGDGTKGSDRHRQFSDRDILDLQVWFLLAWTGEAARRRYPEIKELLRKGRNFSPGDKEALLARHVDILGEIIPLYRKIHDEGKAELAVSPYYHPILPLLCDMKSALAAMPRANLPAARFRHPEDARSQVARGIARFREIFGFSPVGMWPSEGSVSDEALSIIAGCGIKWVATDEDILARTLPGGLGPGKGRLYHPYTFLQGARELKMFFRDHQLSDLIGFTYSSWDTSRAVEDFMGRLRAIREQTPDARVVPVILDGENAWEYYPENGYGFLKRLYGTIASADGFELLTCSETLDREPERRVIERIHPGSWINADYGIWVGHPEENQAWDYLERAREAAVTSSPAVAERLAVGDDRGEVTDDNACLVCTSLYAAEGSDWFWWYGDDHFSAHSDRFDRLFRRHLMNVYRLLGLDVPRELFEPIKKTTPAGLVREPAALITPQVNGRVDDYFEWLAAGLFDLSKQSSAMHAAESLFQSFFYGFDRKNLYFRLDSPARLTELLQPDDELHLNVVTGGEFRLDITPAATDGPLLRRGDGTWYATGSRGAWAIDRICEVAIPLAPLGLEPRGKLFASVTLTRGGEEFGRWPADASLLLAYAGPELEIDNWMI